MSQNNNQASDFTAQADCRPTTLEEIVANTCFCKLRETCHDKHSTDCMRNRNIYQEFMESKAAR
jgi:hypothetical protein